MRVHGARVICRPEESIAEVHNFETALAHGHEDGAIVYVECFQSLDVTKPPSCEQ